MNFNPHAVWNELSESAREFVKRYEHREHIEAKTFEQKKAKGMAEIAKQLETLYICRMGHTFALREARNPKHLFGCCPKCGEIEICIATGNTIAEQVKRWSQPAPTESSGPTGFDPDNDLELQDDYAKRDLSAPDSI